MERVKFKYSMKNIPIPSKNAYSKNLIFKLESVIKRIRWKAYFFENSNEINETTTATNFGFKSGKTPPKNEHLNAFKNDLYDLVRNIEFKRINTAFQNQLNKDINLIIMTLCYLFRKIKLTTFINLIMTNIRKAR